MSSLNTDFTSQWKGEAPQPREATPDAGAAAVPVGAAAAIDYALLTQNLALGFLGGLLLNLMPCVLPVIGLKILSFVEQSKDRSEAFYFNVVYALGVFAVFMALAALSHFLHLSWGEQFGYSGFKIALIVLVFAMALSFLGVWELPIPGFAGGTAATGLTMREGTSGAFFKGVFATLLATPCSGPLMGPLFAYSLDKPPIVTYALFASLAFGMASPYLLIGAMPGLIRWIPKPGAWMETFKQLMGFILLFTVVFLFYTLGDEQLFVPTLSLLIGVWFGCWLIGRTPLTVDAAGRFRVWATAIGLASLVGFVSFRVLTNEARYVQWQEFSQAELAAAQEAGKTVMVDFTANWCLTCKMNQKLVLDTKKVAGVIDEFDVIPMLADWTNVDSPQGREIKSMLASLGYDAIPLLVIFPGGNPNQPIVLPDVLTKDRVIDALRSAGPSQTVAVNASVTRDG